MDQKHTAEPLKPCPFCGSKSSVHKKTGYDHKHFYVSCTNMMCFMEIKTVNQSDEESAIKAWNHQQDHIEGIDDVEGFVAKMKHIASQETTEEIDYEENEDPDFEGAYDLMIEDCRKYFPKEKS